MKLKTLLVLDSLSYREKELEIISLLEKSNYHLNLFYTDYENTVIRFFHGVKYIGSVLSHISYWMLSFLYSIKIFINGYNKLIFINPIVGYFYLLLCNVCNKSDVNIVLCGFLFENKNNMFYYKVRHLITSICLRKATKVVVYSRIEIVKYSKIFPKFAPKFTFVEYGRDFSIWGDQKFVFEGDYFASGGASNRNYELLDKAISIIDSKITIPCIVATRPHSYLKPCYSRNLIVRHDIRIGTFNDFLKKSNFVVIPLKELDVSAGQMVLLQSMSLGKIILISNIKGIKDYVSDDEVVFFENTPEDLAEKIIDVFSMNNYSQNVKMSQNAKVKYDEKFCFGAFLVNILNIANND